MKPRRALQCLTAILLYLLTSSGPIAVQAQGDIPVVNPTTPGGGPTINPPSTPEPPQTGPTTTPTGGGTTPTGGGTTPTGGGTTPTGGGTTPTGGGTTPTGGGQWCIASQTASPTALQVALDYACGYGGADCSPIQPGSSCYEPNTAHDHASYAFNDYYQKHPGPMSCNFGGTAQLTNTDPSNGNCHYTPPSGSTSISPPSPPSPPDYTAPTTTTTPTTTMPGGGPTVYGVAEPTGQPSSATYPSHSLSLVFAAAGVIMPLLRGNNL